MTHELGAADHRISLLAPGWFDQIFGTGTEGRLMIDGSLQSDLVRAVDSEPLTHGFGVQIGVIGRAKDSKDVITGRFIVRGPTYGCSTMLTIIVGPELSKPPTAPDATRTHKIIAELFSTTLTCGLAVAGWIGAIASVPAAGVTGGFALGATVYFSSAAAMSTVQCIGGLAHSGLVLNKDLEKAKALEENAGWQAIDRTADFFNLFALMYVGRDVVLLTRALSRSGVGLTSAMTAEFSDAKAVTISDLLRLAPQIKDPAEVAREMRTRVLNVALLGLGVYNSSRDASGGYVAVRDLAVGEASAAPPPAPVGSPAQNASAGAAVQVGLPSPPGGGVAAPRVMDTMLNYKPEEVAMISVCLLKKDY